MEYTFTLEALPIVGGVLIVLVLLICEIGSAGFGTHRAVTATTSGPTRCSISGSPAAAAAFMCWRAKPRRRSRCATPAQAISSRCGPALRQKPK